MSLVASLLGAIVRLDGDSLVLHVGEKPYVVTSSSAMNEFRGPLAWGQVELSTRVLTVDAVNGLLDQLLTADQRRTLDDIGAVDRELPPSDDLPAFTVIAARGGDDIWLEVRPVRAKPAEFEPEAEAEPEPEIEPVPVPAAVPWSAAAPPMASAPALAPPLLTPATPAAATAPASIGPSRGAQLQRAAEPAPPAEPPPMAPLEPLTPEPVTAHAAESAASFEIVPEVEQEQPDDAEVLQLLASAGLLDEGAHQIAIDPGETAFSEVEWVPEDDQPQPAVPRAAEPAAARAPERSGERAPELVPAAHLHVVAPEPEGPAETPVFELRADDEAPLDVAPPAGAEAPEMPEASEPEVARAPAVVLPMSRPRESTFAAGPGATMSAPSLDRLLRLAAARGASGLYLIADSQPVIRIDGEMRPLEDEESLTAADVEAFMLALAPEPSREAVRTGATSEWFRDVSGVGRVRCLSFNDHRGAGLVVRMLPARAISVDQLGLSKEIQALCGQPEGLVLITGPRRSGSSTLVAAFVDLVNRSRSDHVITIERQISFVHESRRSFVSQREVRGETDQVAAAVRAALREDPDVLVIEELRSSDVAAAALDAAESGRLVFAGLRAPATVPAIERFVELFSADRRPRILSSLAASLRGVVGQVLMRKRGGGRVAARELLLNTPAAAALIAEGKLFQLPAALESGRKLGSVALNDSLAALIRDAVVDAGEAWRKAHDREGLLTALKREGIDTSFVERLA